MSGSFVYSKHFVDNAIKGTGIPTFLSSDVLAGGMVWYAVDTGIVGDWYSIVADTAGGHTMDPPTTGGLGTPDTTTMTPTVSTAFGKAISWTDLGFNNTHPPGSYGYVGASDNIRTITNLSGSSVGTALTLGTTFFINGPVNNSDSAQIFGRPIAQDQYGYGCPNLFITSGSSPVLNFVWTTVANANPPYPNSAPQTIAGTTVLKQNVLYSVVMTMQVVTGGSVSVFLYLNGHLEGSATGSTFYDNNHDNEDQIQFAVQYHSAAPQSYREMSGSVFQGFYSTTFWTQSMAQDFATNPFRMLKF